MLRLTATERRTLSLAVALLGLGTGVRLALDPGPAEYAWQPTSAERPAETLDEVRRSVADTLARAAEAERPLAPGETIDPNRADAVQLQRLPGVGPARAAAILRERERGGPFATPSDLTRVSGIGPALVERWSDAVRLSPPRHPIRPPDRAAATESGRVDLNRAHPKELEQITGIGPALARRIVDHRKRRGRFDTVDELLEIPGIGAKTLEIVRKQAYVR
ncbi:MAG: ComEA family DNA-binding protein [Gemmatimonadales bacterium]|jgi:competence ComEA-like helix-hairpin-helix protein